MRRFDLDPEPFHLLAYRPAQAGRGWFASPPFYRAKTSGLIFGGVGGIIGRADKAPRKPLDRSLRAFEATARQSDALLTHLGPDLPEAARLARPNCAPSSNAAARACIWSGAAIGARRSRRLSIGASRTRMVA